MAVNKLILGGRACLGRRVGGGEQTPPLPPLPQSPPWSLSVAAGGNPSFPSLADALLWQVNLFSPLIYSRVWGGPGPAVHIWT